MKASQDHLATLVNNRSELLKTATEAAICWLGTDKIEGKYPETQKLFLHVWPDVSIFVWDSNVRLALNTRYRKKLTAARLDGYCYRCFLNECGSDLEDLQKNREFQDGLNHLIEKRGAVLRTHPRFRGLNEADYAVASKRFLERRLYDKFLWREGDFIYKNFIPPKKA